jgi:hypothetical protein
MVPCSVDQLGVEEQTQHLVTEQTGRRARIDVPERRLKPVQRLITIRPLDQTQFALVLALGGAVIAVTPRRDAYHGFSGVGTLFY